LSAISRIPIGDQSVSPFRPGAIPSLTIMESSVVGFRLRISAAPFFPRTRHPVISSTSRTCPRSASMRSRLEAASLKADPAPTKVHRHPIHPIRVLEAAGIQAQRQLGLRQAHSYLELAQGSQDLVTISVFPTSNGMRTPSESPYNSVAELR